MSGVQGQGTGMSKGQGQGKGNGQGKGKGNGRGGEGEGGGGVEVEWRWSGRIRVRGDENELTPHHCGVNRLVSSVFTSEKVNYCWLDLFCKSRVCSVFVTF